MVSYYHIQMVLKMTICHLVDLLVINASGHFLLNHVLHESPLTFATEATPTLHAANFAHKDKVKTAIVTNGLSNLSQITIHNARPPVIKLKCFGYRDMSVYSNYVQYVQ